MKQSGLPLPKLPRRDLINEDKHDESEPLPGASKRAPQPIDYGLRRVTT